MIEHAEELGDEVLVKKPVAAGENVISRGEDYALGQLVLNAGRRITPRDMGVLAATGNAGVSVRRRPVVGIISTGNELVPPEASPGPGMVRDANSYLCAGFVMTRGGVPVTYGIVPDDTENLRDAMNRAVAACDMVLISGGSSKDARDNTAAVIAELGEVRVHGIALSPGKPTIIGTVDGTPVIGLPGHPASAFVVLIAIAGEVISAMTGEDRTELSVTAALTQNIPSARGREDYVRVVVREGMATPVFGKSGLLNTLVQSDGIVRVPASREGLETGEVVDVILW
jgi:molybdopterin molybdotransferase